MTKESAIVRVTRNEYDALHEAIDFIIENSDGALEYEPYELMIKRLAALRNRIRSKINPNQP